MTDTEYEWLSKAIAGQKAVAKAIESDLERLFYSRLAEFRDKGHSPSIAAQLALDAMNKDPWGASVQPSEPQA